MNAVAIIPSKLTSFEAMRRPAAVAIYVGVVCASIVFTIMDLSSISERRLSLTAAENMLAQLEGRARSGGGTAADTDPLKNAPPGSPFLEGQSLNTAGATLLQRVAEIITRNGGSVLSSQLDLQRADVKDGWIGLTVSCQVEQESLQKLLYDIESGMPYLFVDQLVVDAPSGGVDSGRMHVLLTVSGLWLGGK
jgi:general secretion pathway protein M